MLYEQKDHINISECCQNVVQSALECMHGYRLHRTVDLLQQLASSCYKMPSSQLTYFVYSAAVLCSYR